MEEKKIDRKKLEIIIIGVATILIALFSVSYAYFEHQLSGSVNENVEITTDRADRLNFNVNKEISLSINQFNFGVGAGNLSDSAVATATLLANNTNNTATYTYYVYFRINSNDYIYTTADQKPEIILTVTDPTGAPVTSIDGLTYDSTLGGFDITTANGTFAIASAYTITSNSSVTPTTQNWNITATFINLDTDQGGNSGKNMNAEIIIQQNELKPTLAQYVIGQYTGTDGENALYYHDADLENGAEDNSYRYAGVNPNNYVCFGSDEETCPSDNLYRIIGVFGSEVKLIKADYLSTEYGAIDNYENYFGDTGTYKGNMNLSDIGVYAWDSNNSNTWSTSSIRSTLNTTYYNTLSSTWQNKIATHTWKVGGMDWSETNTTKQYYDVEVGSSSSSTTDSMKIGLMYVSDYGYAASNNYWTTTLYNYIVEAKNNDWLYLGEDEWTITPLSSLSVGVFRLNGDGLMGNINASFGSAARPVFYLNSNVSYVSGDGTQSNPFRIN